MHWTDVMAERLAQKGQEHIIATGITPSGEFHIGHLREILTGDMITRAANKAGLKAELVFVVDNADPLRKVYPFLDESYQEFIGQQLGAIPAPDSEGKPDWNRFEQDGWTYGDHFLTPFLGALKQIGVEPRLIPNLEAYQSGLFANAAKRCCDDIETVKEIIERVSSRELPEGWFPWQPLNSKNSLDGVTVTGYDYPLVHWSDEHGEHGSSDITKGEGKLPWRLDWPAKWGHNGVTCEPFGKDHGASGGSYDTGKELSVFMGHAPPLPLTYEWISLRGQGAMSSSTGNTVGPIEALELVPPQILRFLIANSKPNKAIEFDTGMGLVNLADEYERLCSRDFETELNDETKSRRQRVQIEDAQAALRLSMISEEDSSEATAVSFRHLALLAQIKDEDEAVWESLRGSGAIESPSPVLQDRLMRMRAWIKSSHFPEEMRIQIMTQPNHEALDLLEQHQRDLLPTLLTCFVDTAWDVSGITAAIKAVSEKTNAPMKDVYRTCYAVFMGTERGPRLAPILCNCDQEVICQLIRECTSYDGGSTES